MLDGIPRLTPALGPGVLRGGAAVSGGEIDGRELIDDGSGARPRPLRPGANAG
jgi:hypothetical protein